MSADESKHRILVVEDEAMVSMLLEDMVLDCGGEIIGPVARFETALALARAAEFDVAVLDLNLNGTLSYPIAEAFVGAGSPPSSLPGTAGLDCRRGSGRIPPSKSRSVSRILPRRSRWPAICPQSRKSKAYRHTSENLDQ